MIGLVILWVDFECRSLWYILFVVVVVVAYEHIQCAYRGITVYTLWMSIIIIILLLYYVNNVHWT